MRIARVPVLLLLAFASACGGGGSGDGGPPPEFDGVVTVTGGKNRITLTWNDARPSASVTYHIYRRRAAEQHDFSSSLDRTSSLSYSDTSTVPDVDYFYVVRATRNGVDFDDNVVELSDYAVSVALPEDDGPHSPYDVEWWYYTGHLDNGQGDLWGFEFVFFKLEVGAQTLYLGNFAITDHQRQAFTYAEKPGTNQNTHPPDGFSIRVGDWVLVGGDGDDHVEATLDDPQSGLQYTLDIDVTALKDPVLQGRDGFTGEGSEFESFYYSRPRMAVSGTLDDNGTVHAVSGEAWMDHQWLDESAASGLFVIDGWDWFSVQLENGIDLMLTEIRLDLGGLAYAEGTWVADDGSYDALDMSLVVIQSTGDRTNPVSGNTYPSGWTVDIPARSLSLTLTPILEQSELWGLALTPIIYWEGEVEVTGTLSGGAVQGKGFVELTGYDD